VPHARSLRHSQYVLVNIFVLDIYVCLFRDSCPNRRPINEKVSRGPRRVHSASAAFRSCCEAASAAANVKRRPAHMLRDLLLLLDEDDSPPVTGKTVGSPTPLAIPRAELEAEALPAQLAAAEQRADAAEAALRSERAALIKGNYQRRKQVTEAAISITASAAAAHPSHAEWRSRHLVLMSGSIAGHAA
jgi:hypothetical protein